MTGIANSMMGDVFRQTSSMPFADLHFRNDPATQLKAIIAIHSTELGPALGGTRCLFYPDTDTAVKDALRLARGMTYKSAINHLPYGGGKAVIIYAKDLNNSSAKNRNALFSAYGDFVESLNGRYITAVDSGTSPRDMDIIAQQTRHVVCTSEQMAGSGDPSPYTARGVMRGIQAAVKSVTGRDELSGRHIVVQGVGHVGYALVEQLCKQGAQITISDTSQAKLKHCADKFNCHVVLPEQIYDVPCDVFSPCALGQTINPQSIARLKTSIIAGAANNQLISKDLAQKLQQAGILYAPDYVINSGGILQIAYIYEPEKIIEKIDKLYDTLLEIFSQAKQQNLASSDIADKMAEAVIEEHRCKKMAEISTG